MTTRQWRRRLGAIGLGCGFALVALEIVMQVVAFVWWSRLDADRRTTAPSGKATILCLGDSFTFGLGASDRSGAYPSVLERALDRDAPGRWQVINRGVPGRASGEVLRVLGSQLATFRPLLVYLLIGYNDRWDISPEVLETALDDEPEAFSFKLRTVDLLRRIVGALTVADDVPDRPAELFGLWHVGDLEVLFESDGALLFGGIESRWHARGESLTVGNGVAPEVSLQFTVTGDELELIGPSLTGGSLRLVRGARTPEPTARVRAAIHDGRVGEARALLASIDDPVQRLASSVEVEALGGDDAAVERGLAELRELEASDPAVSRVLARVLLSIGRAADGIALIRRLLDEDPVQPGLWQAIMDLAVSDARWCPPVLECIDAGIVRLSGREPWESSLLLNRSLLRHRVGGDPALVFADALRAGFAYGEFPPGMTRLLHLGGTDASVVDRACDLLELSAAQRQKVAELVAGVPAAISGEARLERHLIRCAELCRQRGAKLVLLTYPEPPEVGAVTRRVAAAGHAELIDVQPRFRTELVQHRWEELFIADGHCNDRGYALIAELVLAHVRAR